MAGARYVNAAVTYDVLRDFTQISLVETSPFVLVVHPSVPARNLKEYIALARSRPGKMTFATIGAGQIPYWSVILFNSMARIDAVEIQIRLLLRLSLMLCPDEVDYTVTPAVAAVTNHAKLRALAVTTTTRSPMLPDVPTMHEAALPGYAMPAWRSILGPAGMRPDIVVLAKHGNQPSPGHAGRARPVLESRIGTNTRAARRKSEKNTRIGSSYSARSRKMPGSNHCRSR